MAEDPLREKEENLGLILVVLLTSVGLLVLVVLAVLGYVFGWSWTGFPQKTLFDWIQILAIPVAVTIGAFALNQMMNRREKEAQRAQQAKQAHQEMLQAQQEERTSLQTYLEYISRLVTDPDRPLRRSHLGDNLSMVARAQTLTVLARLGNEDRKRRVLTFLYEVGLINKKDSLVISLEGGSLSKANLYNADFYGIYLYRAYLREAHLQMADLREANLQHANLQEAHLGGAYLQGANLQGADLDQAYLVGAKLKGANFCKASLQGANIQDGWGPGYRPLPGMNFEGANFQEANLNRVNLQDVNLSFANLREAKLERVNLKGVNLQGANLQGVDLRETRELTQEQLDQAIGDGTTKLPEIFEVPQSWPDRMHN